MKTPAPNIGDLQHLVAWIDPPATRAQSGQPANGKPRDYTQYTATGTRRVAMKAVKAEIVVNGQKPEGVATWIITQRYLSTLTFNSVMAYDSRHFRVTGFYDLDGLKQWQVITVVELKS